jgi:hypothetical protein
MKKSTNYKEEIRDATTPTKCIWCHANSYIEKYSFEEKKWLPFCENCEEFIPV